MSARYAIYLVPSAASRLWERGCRWLGRDAETGTTSVQPVVPGFSAAEIHGITASPRAYGFHATLKAPFRLAHGAGEVDLMRRVASLAASLASKRVPRITAMPKLQVDQLNGFFALRDAGSGNGVNALAAHCVTTLDDLRAPIDAAEQARRLASDLSARQRELLAQWGYPYVLDEFRFHLTLSERLDPARSERLRRWLEPWFAPALAGAPCAMDIGVFVQEKSDAVFTLRQRFSITL